MTQHIISKKHAIEIISTHGVVALPTETVYGLFGRADSKKAIERVYAIKNRPLDNPLICHVATAQDIEKYTTKLPSYFYKLAHAFCPGPLSFLLPLKPESGLFPHIPNLKTVVFRIPKHDITGDIIKQVGVPLFGPSANTSTKVSGVFPEMIMRDLGELIDGIYDGGVSNIGVESTIIDCRKEGEISILRPGVIGKIELELAAPLLTIHEFKSADITTPGSKYKHYSPDCKITLEPVKNSIESIPLIGFIEDVQHHPLAIPLGSQKHPKQAAQLLYKTLYSLDKEGYTQAYFSQKTYTYITQSSHSTYKALSNRLAKIIQL